MSVVVQWSALAWPMFNPDLTSPPPPLAEPYFPQPNLWHIGGSSCDACYVRRVRCERPWLQQGDTTCESCRKRGIKCSDNRVRKNRPRAPKRRAQPASNDAPTVSPPIALPQAQAQAVDDTPRAALTDSQSSNPSPSSNPGEKLSADSASVRLYDAEETEAFMATMMDTYLASATFDSPIVNWEALRIKFSGAGRRPAQLDVMTRSLVLACITMGSIISDHPLLVGTDAPSLDQLRVLGDAPHLSVWARRRRPTCDQLVEDFLSKVDRSGAFEVACVESVAVLTLAADVLLFYRGEHSSDATRPYWAAAVGHCRIMAEEQHSKHELASATEWKLAMHDAISAASSGRSFVWTDDDLDFILRSGDVGSDMLTNALVSRDYALYRSGMLASMRESIIVNRSIATKLTRKLHGRHRRRIPPEVFVRFVDEIEAAYIRLKAANDYGESTGAFADIDAQAYPPRFGFPNSMHLINAPMAVGVSVLLLYRSVRDWRAVSSGDPAEARATAYVGLRLRRLLTDIVCYITSLIDLRKDQAGVEVLTYLSPFTFARYNLSSWAGIATALPCADEGGMPEFSWPKKQHVFYTLLRGLRAQAFVWPDREEMANARLVAFWKVESLRSNSPAQPISGSPSHASQCTDSNKD